MDSCRVLVCLALCAVWHVGPTLGQSQIDMNVLARLENLEKQVSGQQTELKEQSKRIADLQTRVANQESAIARQQATITEQQTTIVDQQKTISEQQKTISEQQDELSKQQSSLSEQGRRLIRLEGILMATKTNNGHGTGLKMDMPEAKTDQQGEVTNGTIYAHTEPVEANKDQDKQQDRDTTNTIRRLNKRLVLVSESPIAFHAVNTGAQTAHAGIGQNIMFPTVKLNLGSGYHAQHSIFIAPAAGLYIFSTSIMSYIAPHSEIQASMVKNGAVLANVFAHGDAGRHDQGSVTVVTQLTIGDEVWVSDMYPADVSYFGQSFTTFTGCLLWPM